MELVKRESIVANATYVTERPTLRPEILAIKADRRIHLGSYLTFLFETTETMRYQIQEMMRIEGLEKETDIQHELTTYNDLLGGPHELGCTLMVEIADPLQRDILLRNWLDLPHHLYIKLDNGTQARAQFDPRQVGEDRLSSVQYLKFNCGDGTPTAIGLDKTGLELEAALTDPQRAALAEDLTR